MKIKICSRKTVERLLQGQFPENTAVISFYDPYGKAPVNYSGKADNVLYVPLDDLQKELPESEKIARFINDAKANGLNIICQCESGQSRSAGCAAAILEHNCHMGQSVFDSDRYRPDEMVYYELLNALKTISYVEAGKI